MLIAGIIGVKNNNRPEKAVTCLVWGIIVLAVNIVGMVFTFLGRPDNFLTIFVSCIAGIGLPVLYIIGAALNRSSDKS